ncbi:cysteine desulfurase family protein [Lapidilactobacillus luobeiensis]|uniref:cysteine desulfurase family protein n=1 Tax=Lapidilactobacillus luobeiensis TaxID=2950371 RepID=UPI0021C420F9|nr:cysteine desulfurase family protein [Lapidilactobacillus luobeiensis]
MIYLDHAATTAMSPTALAVYQKVAQNFFANSESLHQAGTAAGQLLQEARGQVGQLLGVDSEGLIFTSGGTAANHLGIDSLAHGTKKKRIVVSPLEHASVYQILTYLATNENYQIQYLPVNAHGHVDVAILRQALTPDTGLVVIQATNPITGLSQPIPELAAVAQTAGVPLFVDAVQAVGKQPIDLHAVAGFSASAHKFNGPKGCGLLYLAPTVLASGPFHPVYQQNGFLPGTLDTPAILSMVTALTESCQQQATSLRQLQYLKHYVLAHLPLGLTAVAPQSEFPGICGLLLPHRPGQEVATVLGQQGICVSTVSACSLKDPRPDPALTALGYSAETADRYLRVSFGPENTTTELDQLLAALRPFSC